MDGLQSQHIRTANLPHSGTVQSVKLECWLLNPFLCLTAPARHLTFPLGKLCARPFSYYHHCVYAANSPRRLQLASRKAPVACETTTFSWGHRITRVLLQTCPTSDNLVSWSLSQCSLVHIDPDLVPVEEPHCSFLQ